MSIDATGRSISQPTCCTRGTEKSILLYTSVQKYPDPLVSFFLSHTFSFSVFSLFFSYNPFTNKHISLSFFLSFTDCLGERRERARWFSRRRKNVTFHLRFPKMEGRAMEQRPRSAAVQESFASCVTYVTNVAPTSGICTWLCNNNNRVKDKLPACLATIVDRFSQYFANLKKRKNKKKKNTYEYVGGQVRRHQWQCRSKIRFFENEHS